MNIMNSRMIQSFDVSGLESLVTAWLMVGKICCFASGPREWSEVHRPRVRVLSFPLLPLAAFDMNWMDGE